MAKYDVECPKCETTYTVQLYGPGRDRDWKLDNWDWTCEDCRAKERQQKNEEAAKVNEEAGLPSLTGTEKMIAWAETIRKQKLATLEEKLKEDDTPDDRGPRFLTAFSNLQSKTSASWWIEHRDTNVLTLLKMEYEQTEIPLSHPEQKIAEEAKTLALAEATLRPPKPITETAEYKVIGDLCMGRGLVGLHAFKVGRAFRGTELNKRRLAVLLEGISKAGGEVKRVA